MEKKKLKGLINFLLIGIIIISNYFCSADKKSNFDKNDIHFLCTEDTIIPSNYSLLLFFCRGSNNSIVKLKYKELREVYNDKYNYLDYCDFLFNLLNQSILLDTDNINSFKLNDSVSQRYNMCNINDFLNYYCEKTDSNEYRFIKELSENEFNTFSYFLFINGYFIIFDDYIGFYYVIYKNKILI